MGDRPEGDGLMTGLDSLIEAYTRQRVQRQEFTRDTGRNVRSTLCGFVHRYHARLTTEAVEAWLGALAEAGLAAATRRTQLYQLRAFIRWLMRHGHLERDPTVDIRAPALPRLPPRDLRTDAVEATLDVCPDARARAIVMLMIQEGLRCVEVSRLEIGDVDLRAEALRVTGKGGHERVLPITSEAARALDEYLTEHPARVGPLIRSYIDPAQALTPGSLSRYVARWMREAGVKRCAWDGVSAHSLRHTAAADMLRSGAHVRDVQRVLGHAHLQTTERYMPLVIDGLRTAMEGRTYRPHPLRAVG